MSDHPRATNLRNVFALRWERGASAPRNPTPQGKGALALGFFPLALIRALQCVLLCAVTVAMLGANEGRFNRIGHELMCSCGCGQILLECNHVSCPDSPVMIAELHQQLDSGASDVAIENWFVAKYGPPILAAPIRGGFDNVAWIMPMAVLFLATVGTAALVWIWKRRSGAPSYQAAVQASAATTPEDPELRERIRRETEYR